MSEAKNFRLGVDVGGTYTDFVLLDESTGTMKSHKIPSTPDDMSIGVMRGLEELGVSLASVKYIVHGATVGVNSIIQQKGANTGLLSTRRFRDVLEIGDMAKPDMYNLFFQKPRPLVSRENSLPIDERVASSGEILKPVQEEDVRAQVNKLKERGVASVAICTLNSYANPENEEKIAQVIEREFPELDVSVSSRIVRERNEIYRANTVTLNAYIAPALRRYLTALEEKLQAKGFQGVLFIMSSSGGVMSSDKTKKMPIYTLLSGPVGGSTGGQALGKGTGLDSVITFDMGGTSCDISVILNGIPEVTHEGKVERYQVMTPMVRINYLGAGGGSIAQVVGETSLRVGPESAGANPGPACYGAGGTAPTVTDANLVLGRLEENSPLAGGVSMRLDLARKAIKEQVADKLGLSVEDAALGIIKIACTRMAYAIREVTVQEGLDPREFTLISFGGAGPMHTPFIAQLVGIKKLVVPSSPGTFCAWGMLNTDVRHDLVKTVDYAGRALALDDLTNAFRELEEEGRAAIHAEGVAEKDVHIKRSVDMRYRGQDHTLTISIPSPKINQDSIAEVRRLFDETHLRNYAHNSPEDDVEFINIRLEVSGHMKKAGLTKLKAVAAATHDNLKSALIGRRKVTFEYGTSETSVYARSKLLPGMTLSGPAVIVEDGSTTIVPPGFSLEIDEYGNMLVDVPIAQSEEKSVAKAEELDPITVEVIRNALIAAAEEMSIDIQRSAHNWIITKGKDHSTGIYGPNAETFAQAQGLPEFVCDMPTAVQSIIKDLGGVQVIKDGDVYLTNDPYANTFHVNDVNAIKPVFDNGELIAFCGTRVHWHDIGGSVRAGNMTATEVFQEGLILRTIKIMDASGEMDRNVLSIIRENNRIPDHTIGDLKAQLGALTIGEQRLKEVIARYGVESFKKGVQQILRNGEKHALDALARIPDGMYEAGTCLDNDGVDLDIPLPIKVKVIKKGDTMTFDLTGSAEGCRGPMNCNTNTVGSICRMIFKMLTTPREAANEGHFRSVKVIIPEKSIFRATKPAATLPGFFALEALIDCAKRALAPAVPDLVNADDYGKCTPAHIAFLVENGEFLFLPDTEGGGWGGKPYEDGENALLFGACPIVSTEDHEAKFPVRLSQYVLRQDSGGPGKYRGGVGIMKDYEALMDCTFNAGLDRQLCPPQGVLGGGTAKGQRLVVKKPDGSEDVLPSKVSDYPVKKGEVISFQTAGGGGYGNPLERDVALIEQDLRRGLVSIEAAEKDYGVSVDRKTLRATRTKPVAQ